MLVLQRSESLVQRTVSAIRAEIDSGRFAASTRMPTEHELAEQLQVSRSVIREAVSQLKADGVLTTRRGLGSYVSEHPEGKVFRFPGEADGVLDLGRLFEMRVWLETQAAAAAAQRRTVADLKCLGNALSTMQSKSAELNAAAAADVAFHRGIVAATQNTYFVAFHDFLRGQLAAARRAAWANSATKPSGPSDAHLEHQAIFEAIKARDSVAAAECSERHLIAAAARLRISIDMPSLKPR
ncbi:GntR family transcriptional regulator [Pseudomonas agarici]|uniref:GntR family transcriptional regulator n=1 Tax=Pseudomonas agarici TaxID=46677 RepID=A0A0X1T4E6_PSEAA|nr:FadR/GntR family transcriptional regulator [Pseudomonas agarici]AMB86955.1 GntR family transcriptional regulator [Pseudomonas agarici]NWB93883.1 FadR family transcriptional regulator [Pseudomonas agarici]NWC07674.1 FadR family transcriptional regulator [Pseudomonas agarici]SEL76420.1 transcriptional regulator, GntR family [Pseudomonas agarici]